MKNIQDWLKIENIHIGMEAHSELSAMRLMIDLTKDNPAVIDRSGFARAIEDFEMYKSALDGCCSISFYALTDAVNQPLFVFCRFDDGIGYYSKYGRPIDLISLLVAPVEAEQQLADALISTRNLLCFSDNKDKIRKAESKEEVYKILTQYLRD